MTWKFFELPVSLFLMAATASLGLKKQVKQLPYKEMNNLQLTNDNWTTHPPPSHKHTHAHTPSYTSTHMYSLTHTPSHTSTHMYSLTHTPSYTHPLSDSLIASHISRWRARFPADAALSVARSTQIVYKHQNL